MLRSFSFLRDTAGLAVFLPISLLASACNNSTGGTGGTGGSGGAESTGVTSSAVSTGATGGSGTGGSGGSGGGTTGSGSSGGTGGSPVVPDTTAPQVVSTLPADAAKGVTVKGTITVTFDEPMDPKTLNAASFTLKQGAVDVPGGVTYFNNTASLLPDSDLALGATYTATVTTAATDVAGNKLALAHSWSFATDAALPKGPAPVLLGAAGKYVILAKSAISNVPTSVITGNLGLSPAAASFVTGFSLTRVGTKWTSPQVVGGVFAADNDPPTPTDLTTAISNMQTAYTDAAGRPTPDALNLGAGSIGGSTLLPGLYKWTTSLAIPGDITISGAQNDVWIFQITGDLDVSSGKSMTLVGGAKARNVFWQVAGMVNLGTTAHAEGIILSKTAIKLGTGASINGRLMAQTAVNIASAVVTEPAP